MIPQEQLISAYSRVLPIKINLWNTIKDASITSVSFCNSLFIEVQLLKAEMT